MDRHHRGLMVVLIAAIFSLATLQGLNLLINAQRPTVLGETIIRPRPSPAPTYDTPTPARNSYIPCDELTQLQRQFCPIIAIPTPRPTNIGATTIRR